AWQDFITLLKAEQFKTVAHRSSGEVVGELSNPSHPSVQALGIRGERVWAKVPGGGNPLVESQELMPLQEVLAQTGLRIDHTEEVDAEWQLWQGDWLGPAAVAAAVCRPAWPSYLCCGCGPSFQCCHHLVRKGQGSACRSATESRRRRA